MKKWLICVIYIRLNKKLLIYFEIQTLFAKEMSIRSENSVQLFVISIDNKQQRIRDIVFIPGIHGSFLIESNAQT